MAAVHVQWLDNFSKFYAIAVQGLGTGAFADCLWTAAGLHRYVGPVVSTSLQPSVPGMPSSLVSPTVISLFKQKMAVADAVSEGFLKDSVCSASPSGNFPSSRRWTRRRHLPLLLFCASRATGCGISSLSACSLRTSAPTAG